VRARPDHGTVETSHRHGNKADGNGA
jgi:hypothetical protein